MLEQDQNEGRQVVKRVIAYASKTLRDMQCRYCTTNKELLAVMMAIELFRYYLTGRHFTVVTDYASVASQLQRTRRDGCTMDSTPTAI